MKRLLFFLGVLGVMLVPFAPKQVPTAEPQTLRAPMLAPHIVRSDALSMLVSMEAAQKGFARAIRELSETPEAGSRAPIWKIDQARRMLRKRAEEAEMKKDPSVPPAMIEEIRSTIQQSYEVLPALHLDRPIRHGLAAR